MEKIRADAEVEMRRIKVEKNSQTKSSSPTDAKVSLMPEFMDEEADFFTQLKYLATLRDWPEEEWT